MHKKLIIGVAIAAVALALAFVLWRSHGTRPPTVSLSDGKQVILQAVTYGTNHTFVYGSETLDKIQRYLPFTRRWLPPLIALRMPTPEEFLVLHYSVYDPAVGKYVSLRAEAVRVIDEHGCTFLRNHPTGYKGSPRFSVASALARAFPRRQKTFTVQMKFPNYSPIDFTINNPLPPNTNQWAPEPLPATRTTNNLAVTLTKITVDKDHSYATPFQDIYEDGTRRNNWYGVSRTFRDATGNASGTFLCPHERAWKLELELSRHADTPFPDSSIWRITNIAIPESATVRWLTNTPNKVETLSWQPIALCGPGYYVFSNDVCVFSAPFDSATGLPLPPAGRRPLRPTFINDDEYTFACRNPSLLVRIDGARDVSQLLIRAKTPNDKLEPFRFGGSTGKLKTYELDNPLSGQPITLEFIPQQPIRVEFLVEPPRP